MQSLDSLIHNAERLESSGNWQTASRYYLKAASAELAKGNCEIASEWYMKAAVCLERMEEWRQIGLLWLHSAAALQGQSEPIGKGRYIDADAAKHNFPTIDPLYWKTLSKQERIGRALRNSGYHLEKAGTNQSAYKQYHMAGSVFQEAGLWDEASRSYMLAARSYIHQHGELDPELLEDLEKSLEKLRQQNKRRYLRRLILYYRHLRVDLTNRGNTEQANEIYTRECQAITEQHGLEKRVVKKKVFQVWGITSCYGTSFKRWLIVSAILALAIFPLTYIFILISPEKVGTSGHILRAFIQSINAFSGSIEINFTYPLLVNLVILFEMGCGYVMLGSLIAMIVSKITR